MTYFYRPVNLTEFVRVWTMRVYHTKCTICIMSCQFKSVHKMFQIICYFTNMPQGKVIKPLQCLHFLNPWVFKPPNNLNQIFPPLSWTLFVCNVTPNFSSYLILQTNLQLFWRFKKIWILLKYQIGQDRVSSGETI